MPSPPPPPRARALAACAFAAVTLVLCAALFVAAALMSAPPAVLPLVALTCVGCPVVAVWHLPDAIAVVRAAYGRAPVAELRRSLAELPETAHPLGL